MKIKSTRLKGILLALGPGLLMAGAAIGGSHLVQSTRAGADYGFSLIWIIFLALLFKYPFFEFGPRYTIATGENLLKGYYKLGKWAFYGFLIFTLLSMFIVLATLVMITGALACYIIPFEISRFTSCLIISIVCFLILAIGRYSLLDKTMKVLMVLICLLTIIAAVLISPRISNVSGTLLPQDYWNKGGLIFIVALMGWMPSIIDISVWQSIWSVARWKQTGYKPSLKEVLTDFNIGYAATAVMAVVFVMLGTVLMYEAKIHFSNNGTEFAGQLIHLYTKAIGQWSYPIIIVGVFSTMFSTSLAAMDAYARVFMHASEIIDTKISGKAKSTVYIVMLVLLNIGVLTIITLMKKELTGMVDFTTTISFLVTPVLAFLNYKIIFKTDVPENMKPGKKMKILSRAGIIFWSLFALAYIYIIIVT